MQKTKTQMQDLFGDSVQTKILESLLEGGETDVSMATLAEESGVSKSRAYDVIKELQKKKYIIQSRRVKNKQLYKLNIKNQVVNELFRLFKKLLTSDF